MISSVLVFSRADKIRPQQSRSWSKRLLRVHSTHADGTVGFLFVWVLTIETQLVCIAFESFVPLSSLLASYQLVAFFPWFAVFINFIDSSSSLPLLLSLSHFLGRPATAVASIHLSRLVLRPQSPLSFPAIATFYGHPFRFF